MNEARTLCLLGFGEVGQTLAPALARTALKLIAFDKQFVDEKSEASVGLKRYPSVGAANSAAEAAGQVDLIISAVTAGQSLAAASAAAAGIKTGAWFLDLNSVSPATKRETAAVVEEAGGRYVEAAVMAPIGPKGIASPILLGGPRAEAFLSVGRALGFAGMQVFDKEIGRAAASKMCRSVLIKGLESLLTESLLAARHFGVEQSVVQSLGNLMPGVDWQQHALYMIGRSLQHGTRRAEEMREVVLAVQEAGQDALMSRACADSQQWAARFKQAGEQAENLGSLLDNILRLQAMRQEHDDH